MNKDSFYLLSVKKLVAHIFGYLVLTTMVISPVGVYVTSFSKPASYRNDDNFSLPTQSEKTHANSLVLHDLQFVDAKLIQEYSADYNIDFRLILALIKQESRFNENAVSEQGARGLMQIMPVTHAEISEELNLQDPSIPEENLKAGIHYLAKMLELFKEGSDEDRISLALAAYNAGPSRVYDAQELAAYLNENPSHWSAIQHVLPLLSKRYYSLHQSVWADKRPPNGYYGSFRQTIDYVNHVIETYHSYKQNS